MSAQLTNRKHFYQTIFVCSSIVEGGKRWQRLNLSEAIKTVKVPRALTTSQESPCSIIRQTSSNSLQDPGPSGPSGPSCPPGQCPPASLSRSASNSGKHTRLRQAVSPSQGQAQEAQETQEEVTNVVLLDSGIASIEDSTSARSMVGGGGGVGGVGGKCNGRLQRTSRIEESEPVERSWRGQEQQEPLVTTVPGLTQTNSRCNVQTSGWL